MPPDNDTPNWTPIDNAAKVTGKSDRTLRRWVASGKLAHKRESGRLYVDLSSPALAMADSDQAAPGDTDIAKLRQDIATLTAELATVKAVLNEVIGERDYLRQALGLSLAAQQKLIEAPARRRWVWPWQKTED